MGNPIAFLTCYHVCPAKTGKKDHVGGKIFKAAGTVYSGGLPIARVNDKLACKCGIDTIETGSASVFCEGQPVAYVGSMTCHGGQVVEGNASVTVGEQSSAGPQEGLQAEMAAEPVAKQSGNSDAAPFVGQSSQGPTPYVPQETATPLTSKSPSPKPSALRSGTSSDKEEKELIVEVLGKDHPDGHKFCFFDYEDTGAPPVSLEEKLSTEKTDDSVIYRWDWTKEKNDRRLFMEIETESGDPIRVPFLHQARNVDYVEKGRQKHVVVPVVASTLISGVPKKESVSGSAPKDINPHHHVLCRSGFLYFFYLNKLWREIEVTINEDGTTHYRDVPVESYRTGEDGTFEDRYREVTGVPLQEIWLPSRVLKRWQTMQVAFAESQWTGDRVNFFENYTSHLDTRCDLIEMEVREQDIANGVDYYTKPRRSHVLPTSVLDRQRPRAPGVEWDYDRPEEYLLGKTDGYQSQQMSKAEQLDSPLRTSDRYAPVPEDERPEMNAFCHVLAGIMREKDIEGVDANLPSWESPTETFAPIEAIKNRKIGVIRVEDRLYRTRYLMERHKTGVWFADAILRRAKDREFFDSACLVNTVVIPEEIGGGPNPFNKHKNEMNEDGRRLLSFSMAEHERAFAVAYLREVQDQLLEALGDRRTQDDMAELFTHYGFDYLGAFSFMTRIFQTINTEPFECDSIGALNDDPWSHRGKRWVSGVLHGSGVLSLSLFPGEKDDDISQPYQGAPENEWDGDKIAYLSGRGAFLGSKLAELENTELPDADSLHTLDGLDVLQAAEEGLTDSIVFPVKSVAPSRSAGSENAELELGASSDSENDLSAAGLLPLMRGAAGVMVTIQGNLIAEAEKADEDALEAREKHKRQLDLKRNVETNRLRLGQEKARTLKEVDELADRLNNPMLTRDQRDKVTGDLQVKKRLLPELARRMQELDAEIANRAKDVQELGAETLAIRSKATVRLAHYLRAGLPTIFGNLTKAKYSQAVVSQSYVVGVPAAIVASDYENLYKAALEGKPDRQSAVRVLHSEGKGVFSFYRQDVDVLTMPADEDAAKVLRALSEAETDYVRLQNELENTKKLTNDVLFNPAGVHQQSRLNDARKLAGKQHRVTLIEADLAKATQRLSNLTKGASKAANDAIGAEGQASATRSRPIYRALGHPIFPIGVLCLEAFNIYNLGSSFKKELRISVFGAFAKAGSSIYDFTLLSVTLANRYASTGSVIARNTQFLHKDVIKGSVGKKIAKILGKRLLLSGIFAIAGAAVTVITLAMDASHALDLGNPAAAAANGLLAVGVVSLTLFGLMAKTGSLLMLGPWGWALVGVAALATGIWMLIKYSDEPIQIWLRNGPFGGEDGVPSLKEGRTAYQSLLSLCMGIDIRLSPYEPGPEALEHLPDNDLDRARALALSRSNATLTVKSPAMGLPSSAVQEELDVKMDLVEETAICVARDQYHLDFDQGNAYRKTTLPKDFVDDVVMRWTEHTSDGVVYYLEHPSRFVVTESIWQPISGELNTYLYNSNDWKYLRDIHVRSSFWYVSAQLRLRYWDDSIVALPGKDPEENTAYEAENDDHTKPDFSDEDQPFWEHARVGIPTPFQNGMMKWQN